MKSLVKKIWVLPLFGLMFFWGISMMAIPSKASSLSGNNLVAATKISPIKSLLNVRDEAIVSIRGRVVKFKEGESLVIDDGTEQIAIQYQDKFKPLKLHVGETIAIRGELNIDRNDYREILAQEIYNQNGRVYPQREMTTRLRENQNAQTRFDNNQNRNQPRTQTQSQYRYNNQNTGTISISEILRKTPTGNTVIVEGVIVSLPEQDLLVLRDSSGEIIIDVDDAPQSLNLRKGDTINVEAIVTGGKNGKKELEALKIRKTK
ncbi:MAG: hypothetical protein K940chlam3_01441 [Chlamydiae bacterium]|nr:hypothetical protein [Chlamydiota bacterium]